MGFGRKDLIPLWVGEGDLPSPEFVNEAAIAALRGGETFYTHKRGLPELRQAIADYSNRLYASALDERRVTVTQSGMAAVMMTMQAILAPGDKILVVTPIWPNIMAAVRIAGGEVTPVELDPLPEGGFHLDVDRLAAAIDARTRGLFIASPGNPTGWIMPAEQQRAVLEICRQRGIWYIADEVYARFAYDLPAGRQSAPSLLEIAAPEDPLFVINSFSKAWCMTGWRQGWLVHPEALWPIFDKLVEFDFSGGQAFLQRGCLAAIRDGEAFIKELVERCRQARDLVHQALAGMPRVRLARPAGAFYAFFGVEGMEDSLAFAKEVLEQTNVGLAPGSAFGPGGEGHLRLCFAARPERISQAMERLRPVLS